MRITAKTNTADLRGRLKKYADVTGKDGADALRRYSRIAAVDLCKTTAPYSHNKSAEAKAMGEGAVQRDILRVYYPSTGSRFLNQATGIVRGYYQGKGNANYHRNAERFKQRMLGYQQSNNTAALAAIAAELKFRDVMLDSLDESRHKSERDSRGRVRKNVAPVLVIGAEKELDQYISKTQRKVGLTKAGWAKAAAAIATSNTGDALSGIPAWVKRHVGRASGSIRDRTRGGFLRKSSGVTLINSTPWASKTITQSQIRQSIDITRTKFVKYMDIQIRYVLRKQAGLK